MRNYQIQEKLEETKSFNVINVIKVIIQKNKVKKISLVI